MSRDNGLGRSGSASEMIRAQMGGGFGSVPEAETICFGCSMLSRIRLRSRDLEAMVTMRCSLGYALRSAEDIARCLAVEGPSDCWKTAPTWRVAPVERSSRQRKEAQTETHVTTIGHGDKIRVTDPAARERADVADLVVEQPEVVVNHVQVQGKSGTATETDD